MSIEISSEKCGLLSNELRVCHSKLGFIWGKKKPINIKNFGRTPLGLCPVCPVDMSHLSRHLSRLSCGHSAPIYVNFHTNRPKRPGCPWDVPNLSPGRSRGIPTTKFLYVIFLYAGFFVTLIKPISDPENLVG